MIKGMYKYTLIVLFSALTKFGYAQNIPELLSSTMQNARSDSYQQLNERPLYDSANIQTVLLELQTYYSDTTTAVRAKAYRVLRNAGLASQTINFRQQAVNQLLNGASDEDSGVTGIAIQSLTHFNKEDFDQNAQRKLADLLAVKPPFFDKVLLLTGFVGLNNQIDNISYIINADTLLTNQSRWAAHLALARLGVLTEVSYVVNKVKNFEMNDDIVYELLPDLAYTRQPLAVDYLFEVVNSDELNCEPADPESTQKIRCGYRVLEYLAAILEGFPYEVDDSGDLITDDYRKALADVREWYSNNGNYTINQDTF